MNVRHPYCVLHSFSIKNIFYHKMELRLFYFYMAKYKNYPKKPTKLGSGHVTVQVVFKNTINLTKTFPQSLPNSKNSTVTVKIFKNIKWCQN